MNIIHFLARIFLSSIIIFLYTGASYAKEENSPDKSQSSKLRIKKPVEIMRVPSDIAFFDGDNNKRYLEEFEGNPVLLVFWATWCAPCIKEMPALDRLKRDFKKIPIKIIPISEDFQGISIVQQFYKNNDIRHLEPFVDIRNGLFREMGIKGLPTSFIVDGEGIIKLIIEGEINWNDEDIREMLLDHAGNNLVLPKNSYKDNSLNQNVKTPIKESDHKSDDSKSKEESRDNPQEKLEQKPDANSQNDQDDSLKKQEKSQLEKEDKKPKTQEK